MNYLNLNKITDDFPLVSFDMSQFKLPIALTLADPDLEMSKPIDLLIGADTF